MHKYLYLGISVLLMMILLTSCSREKSDVLLFELLDSSQTGIDFENRLEFLQDFNIYTYPKFYDGGGVAVGDISGNGLPDIYLVSNMGPNRLYLNKGDYRFEDITEQAGVAGERAWSTGVSMIDINGNGMLDIYLSNSGELDDRRNELFINNGDLTFTESAADYGLDDPGYSIQATFFDYNGNGLLDLYLINNANEMMSSFDLSQNLRVKIDSLGGDRLYRNEGGYFTDVTEEAGLYYSVIGFALSASVSDLNRNGYYDIFVANDFFERDYLYINNGDGTFSEELENQMRSISLSSMGSDIADLNNNGWPDIYVTDMLGKNEERVKTVTIFEDWGRYQDKANWGYGHQFTRNTFQLNHGNRSFSEISRFSGVEATDWSWAVLLADLDHNGKNDIFVTNGLVHDVSNMDYLKEISDSQQMRSFLVEDGIDFEKMIEITPSVPIPNFAFGNDGELRFTDRTVEWGLDEPGFSSGAAWADLNGDGALDLVVNNVNGPAWILRNRAAELYPERSWLRIDLQGEPPNTQAVGAQLQAWSGEQHWYREHILQRGFQSSVEPGFHLGLGEGVDRLDSLVVRWPDGRTSRLTGVEVPARIQLAQSEAENHPAPPPPPARIAGDFEDAAGVARFEPAGRSGGLDLAHEKHNYVDFDREPLLGHMRSTEGPAVCSGDMSGNGLDDVYLGGARDQPGMLWLQQADGSFNQSESFQQAFRQDSRSEDMDCLMFDANGNGLTDLYVASGGNSFSSNSSALGDRLYFNDGEGGLERSDQILPSTRRFESTSVVQGADFTGNGHTDLFVGARLRPFAVGMPADGYLLENDGQGRFRDVTEQWAPQLRELGMITDAVWTDWTGNGRPDLVVVGEWMPIHVFRHNGDSFELITGELGLEEATGWWQSVAAADLNGNGRPDLIGGNHGLNSFLRGSKEHPVRMWVGDFAGNGLIEQILATNSGEGDFPFALRHELLEQVPQLSEKYPDYASYAGQTVQQIFSPEQLDRARLLEARQMASVVVWNRQGTAEIEPLPDRAQLAPMYGVLAGQWNDNDVVDILMAGNLYEVKPMFGPYDASRGVHLGVDRQSESIGSVARRPSGGFEVEGAARGIIQIAGADGSNLIVVARNNDTPKLFRILSE